MIMIQNILPMDLLLNILIKKYLTQSYCISFFSEVALTIQPSTMYTYVTPDKEYLKEQILNVSEMGCSDYVVCMAEPQEFMTAFERVVHIGNVRRSDKKIIILPHDESPKNSDLANHLFSMKASRYVANMLLVVNYINDADCELFDLISHKFVGADEENHKPVHLDRWNSCSENFDNQINLFPYDLKNLQGKPLKVACFTYKPYVLLDIDKAVEPLSRDGIEVRIVDEFCRWINCTIEIVREDIDQWGEIYENKTSGIGVIGSVVEDRADIGIGALYSWYEEWRVMDFSSAGVRTAITCIAPAPRLLSSWEMPLMPFSWYAWIAVIITFFYASMGFIIATGFSKDYHPFLTVFGMMISQSQNECGVNWKIRSVTGWLLIIGLILGCAYGAGLATTFTVPRYEPPIDKVRDIVDRHMEWGATHDAWIFSLTLSTEPLVKQLVSQFRIYSFDELRRKSFTRSMAYSVEKLPAGTFAIGEYVTKEAVLDMKLMVEDFYYELCVLMMRKSSPYTDKISTLIGRLHQSGLLLAWETQVALRHLDYKVQLEVRLSRSKNDGVKKPLSFRNVVGIFAMYITGVVISIAIFMVEILLHERKSENIKPFNNY